MKRSKHSLSHYRLATLNQGQLYPIGCLEVLPGDSFRQASSALIRVQPLVAPVMHPVHVQIHHWFVPNRILWDNWESFITNAKSDAPLTVPTINLAAADQPSLALAQALGIGSEGTQTIAVNALPFRAYNLIYNEFYRDQDLTPEIANNRTNTDTATNYRIRNCSWQKDYFTTARAYAQQGQNTSVALLNLNLGQAPIKGIGISTGTPANPATGSIRQTDGAVPSVPHTDYTNVRVQTRGSAPDKFPEIYADMTQLTGQASMDINEWRQAMAIQKIREHRNRYGSRYVDYLRFLGITPSDARLQRPEYLGGGRQTIAFSEVLATAETENVAVGDMAGHGIAAIRTRAYKRFFEEHGFIISLMYVRPQTVYMNQVPRQFLRRTWADYWQKETEMMGEQAVHNVEVYGDSSTPTATFGFIPRHDDYRRYPSYISGEFRTVLDYWHMGRKFTSQPVLNASFVEANPTNRIYASTTTNQLYCMINHQIAARRLVSKRSRNA